MKLATFDQTLCTEQVGPPKGKPNWGKVLEKSEEHTPVFTHSLTYSELKDDVASAALEPVQRLGLGLD